MEIGLGIGITAGLILLGGWIIRFFSADNHQPQLGRDTTDETEGDPNVTRRANRKR